MEIKEWVKENFTQLCIRIGKTTKLVGKTQFIPNAIPIQQKGSVRLQKRVENEFNQLIDQKPIVKLDKRSDKSFISPIVITV